MAKKPILCLDFDGVVHSYVSGWKGPRNIPDPPMPGVFEFIAEALTQGWDVVIHSSRARYWGGISAMRSWLARHAGNMWDGPFDGCICEVRFSRWKPPAVLTIDDRAMRFEGIWPSVTGLKAFRPYKPSQVQLEAKP